jgi:hypothetical protein
MAKNTLYTLENNICSDKCWKESKDHNNSEISNYYTFNTNFTECKAPYVQMQTDYLDHVNLIGRPGVGLSDDCLIDNDSSLRNNYAALTRDRCPIQLHKRVFQGNPSLLRGKGDMSKELDLLSGSDTNNIHPGFACKKAYVMEQSTNYMIPMLENVKEVQDPKYIIQPWIRGGEDTRDYINRAKFIKNCNKQR